MFTNNTYEIDNSSAEKIATISSWIVNWILLISKLYIVIVSNSKAVTASFADSAVDLASQAILSIAKKYIQKHSPDYPVGRSRLEALSVIGCACIMSMASVEVIQFSIVDLYNGLNGDYPELNVGLALYVLLGLGTFCKFFLYLYCKYFVRNFRGNNDQIEALAEDHFNDIISNVAAAITAAIAFHTVAWWVDASGAIVISLVIIYRWSLVMSEQVKKIVGYTAPPEFILMVRDLAETHNPILRVDCIRAYHFGARFNVEIEVVMPGDMTVAESHDIALELQHKLERIEDVERAFVHVDHQTRDGLEHKVERELVRASSESMGATVALLPLSSSVRNPLQTDGMRARPKRIVSMERVMDARDDGGNSGGGGSIEL